MQSFRAHGKLLITGEYFVLDGAVALAMPVKYGQSLQISHLESRKALHWESLDAEGKIWFKGQWLADEQRWLEVHPAEKSDYLTRLLHFAHTSLGLDLNGFNAQTRLDFPGNWGLGSSSTLVSLLAQWWHCDPYELLRESFGGSGYDIACATANGPLLYQLKEGQPKVEEVAFCPPFASQIYFVYLGQKQNSRAGISQYRKIGSEKLEWVSEISEITRKVVRCEDYDEFEYLLQLHETIISRALEIPSIKDLRFEDFPGTIKSLGAWGGDFVMVTAEESRELIRRYFTDKGLDVIIPFAEMAL